MAFTFKVEDGTGLPDATSFVSVAEATDLLFTDKNRYTPFNAAGQVEQESALSLASTYLDTRYKWNGSKTVSTSSLRWPRTGVVDRDEVTIASDIVPVSVEHATALMAALFIENKFSFSDGADSGNSIYPLSEIKVDVIELKYQIPDGSEAVTSSDYVPEEVKYLLSFLGFAISTNNMFAKISK